MDATKRLLAQAKARRESAIAKANQEYRRDLRDIRAIERRLQRESPHPESGKRLKPESAVWLAGAILRELGPLTLTELAVEVLARGFDYPGTNRRLLENLRSAMRYHHERFWTRDGLWGVV